MLSFIESHLPPVPKIKPRHLDRQDSSQLRNESLKVLVEESDFESLKIKLGVANTYSPKSSASKPPRVFKVKPPPPAPISIPSGTYKEIFHIVDDPGKFDNPPEIIGLGDDTGLVNKSRHVVIEMKANESM